MDVSNASMYDGTTATAEAMLMAVAAGKKQRRILMSDTVDEKTQAVVREYAHFQQIDVVSIPAKEGVTDRSTLNALLGSAASPCEELSTLDGIAGVIVQQPNRYGIIEDYEGFADSCHEKKALFIMNSVAFDLALLKTPGEWGADIAVGDGQSLGIPMQFGGPYVGYMCCTEKLIRKMPGRIVGMTHDLAPLSSPEGDTNVCQQGIEAPSGAVGGARCFVLTLQAREQHIRRQKATSNICSNQSLMALFVTIYLSLMGKQGLREAAQLSYDGAHYLCEQLLATGHFTLAFDQPFFNEFCVRFDGDLDALQQRWLDAGFFGGIKVADDTLMLAVTEKRTKEEIDQLIALI
jgi:glycine dehydrogenase subunit 1